MFGGRNKLDEELLRLIGLCNSSTLNTGGFVDIYDARPVLNAQTNKLKGGGFEDCGLDSKYANCSLTFADIENIHQIRDSFEKVYAMAYLPIPDSERWLSSYWLSQLEKSNYRQHLSKILQGTHDILQSIETQQHVILVHCSDGWDRTSQLCALVQLLMDPYYRTLEGFQVLIEKDWCSFGHMFAKRCGHYSAGDLNNRSQIFIQFLDCVHQLWH